MIRKNFAWQSVKSSLDLPVGTRLSSAAIKFLVLFCFWNLKFKAEKGTFVVYL